MGNCITTPHLHSSHSRGVLVLGLDGAGATTILYQLVLGKRLETIPTLGVNHETIHAEGMDLECWDIGGLDKMRPLWRQYSRDSDAFIFVVDTADLPRMKLAADELAKLYGMTSQRDSLHHDRPLLIFANKQDLPTAAPEHLVAHVLGLSALPVHVSKIFPCTANDRQSLQKGIVWLTDQLKNKKPISASSV